MAWDYELNKHYRVREQKEYPWPCKPDPKRMVELYPFDVLTKHPNGTVTKHTGLCMTGIIVPDSDLEEIAEPTRIAVGSMFSNAGVKR